MAVDHAAHVPVGVAADRAPQRRAPQQRLGLADAARRLGHVVGLRVGPVLPGARDAEDRRHGVAAHGPERLDQRRRQRILALPVALVVRVREVRPLDPGDGGCRRLEQQAARRQVDEEVRVDEPHERAVGEGHAFPEQVGMRVEVRGQRIEEIPGVGLDGGAGLVGRTDRDSRGRHLVGGQVSLLLTASHGDEAPPGALGAELDAPAVVHRGREAELVDVELDESAGSALHRSRGKQRRLRVALLELLEDVGRILPGLVFGRDQDRDEVHARAADDLADVGTLLHVPELLVAERAADHRGEVGDVEGLEAVGGGGRIHGVILP